MFWVKQGAVGAGHRQADPWRHLPLLCTHAKGCCTARNQSSFCIGTIKKALLIMPDYKHGHPQMHTRVTAACHCTKLPAPCRPAAVVAGSRYNKTYRWLA